MSCPRPGTVATLGAGRESATLGRVPHCGRVAQELARLTGQSVATCQKALHDSTAIREVALLIQAHVNAGELGTTFVHRIAPIENALGKIPAEHWCAALELAERQAEGAEDLEQTRYLTNRTRDHARARIRANERLIAQLARVNRALAREHELTL